MSTVLDAFLHRLAWYCEAADLSLDKLLVYLRSRIDEADDWKHFPDALIIDTEIQRQAECALCELVAMIPQRGKITACWSHSPGHSVDWAATSLEAVCGARGQYRNLEKVPGPDTHLLAGLSEIASRWRQILKAIPEAEDSLARIDRLKAAEEALPIQRAAWNHALSRKLHRIDPGVANLVEAAIWQWDGPGNRGKALAERFSTWLESAHRQRGGLNAINNDNLFEWLMPLEIAYTATVSTDKKAARWRLEPLESDKHLGRKYEDITLGRQGCRS